MINNAKLIDDLVNDLKPNRYRPPLVRTLLWFLFVVLFIAVGMIYIQPWRVNFVDHLLNFPRFSLEIVSASAFTFFVIYWVFTSFVPGNRLSKTSLYLGLGFLLIYAFSIVASFLTPSPPASSLGARPHCVEEVFVFGIIGAMSLCYFLMKIDYQVRPTVRFLLGMGAAFIPGTLMQMACMYNPLHAFLFHYLPCLIVGFIFTSPLIYKLKI
ncbi:MAG: hypothetical protein KDD40_13035, partial [Bdellovibrionales bacterium]|nr:hypothetical protein [Bdellovibrionales bacterium]